VSRVDVVIPCYNYGRFLTECVTSTLQDQRGTDIRVLIIDDASEDDSAEIAHKLAAADSRVEVVVHRTNRGHIATFNEGLFEWADGDYCVLLSADDKLTAGALGRAVAFMDKHPNVGFVYGHAVPIRPGRLHPSARTKAWGSTIWPGHAWATRRFQVADGCMSSPEVVVRTSVQHQVGRYDSRLPHTSDVEMWMRLALYADVGYIRADQAYYRLHDSNMSNAYAAALPSLRERRRAFEVLLEHAGDRLANAAQLSDIVRRQLARQALSAVARAYDSGRTDQVPVEELIEFAFDCWPAAGRLNSYRGLQLRRRIGPTLMPYLRLLNLYAPVRRVKECVALVHWRLLGI